MFLKFLVCLTSLLSPLERALIPVGVVVGGGGQHVYEVLRTQGLPAVVVFGKACLLTC